MSINKDLQKCFNAYKHRLEDISEEIMQEGYLNFIDVKDQLVTINEKFSPLNSSFSITADPSLHFFIRLNKSISLFVEVFLDMEDGHDTYIQIINSGQRIYGINDTLRNVRHEIEKILHESMSQLSCTDTISID